MRDFLRRRIPPFRRVLLVESGSRDLYEELLPGLYELYGPEMRLDLLTCFAGAPPAFRPGRGRRILVSDYPDSASRARLFEDLKSSGYDTVGIICADEPIMTKWKWAVAARVPAKVFVLNENGDYFWLDRAHWRNIVGFALFRAGLSGAGAVRTLARMILFPVTLLYLLLYAAAVHLRRKVIS